MKMTVFWVVAPCSLVEGYQRFRSLRALMMEAARTSETLLNLCQTTRRYNPEDSHLLTSYCSLSGAFQTIVQIR
jgi:hypothetical protein